MIPKTMFLYWGAERLSWLRYLTAYSFSKLNPDWQIKVYKPVELTRDNTWGTEEHSIKYLGKDWFDELKSIPNLEIYEWDMTKHGFVNDATEVHKSDVFRLWAIHEHGGLYSDFDILYYKPVDLEKYKVVLSLNKIGKRYYSIGFIAGVAKDPMYNLLIDGARASDTSQYQSLGAKLWSTRLGTERKFSKEVWNVPMSLVYPINSYHISEIYDKGELSKKGVGLHWYGGHPISGKWENKLTPDNHDFDNIISNLIKEVI